MKSYHHKTQKLLDLQDVLPYVNSGPQIIGGAENTPSSWACNPAMLILKTENTEGLFRQNTHNKHFVKTG
jgi:hypothetical protein